MKKTILQFAAMGGMLVALNSQSNAQWLTTGNALGSTGFLGSTTNQDVSIISNNTSRMYITKTGNVGIGTNAPAFLLDVFSAGNASANFKSSTGTANLIIDRGNNTATSSVSYRTAGVPTWQTGTVGTDNFAIRNIALGSPSLTVLASNNNVGIGTNAPATTFTVGANKFNVAGADGDLTFSDALGTITFPITTGANTPMIHMFAGGTVNSDRMVIAHSSAYSNWGLQYQDLGDKFNFLGNGIPTLTADLANARVGVGTTSPETKLHITGGNYDLFNGQGDVKIGNSSYSLRMGVAQSGGGSGDAYISSVGGTNTLYLGGGSSFAGTQLVSINGSGRVGIGTGASVPAAKLDVLGSSSSEPVIKVANSVTGVNVDVIGISSTSVTNPGYGFGAFATGGYMGVYGFADATTYNGSAYGVYGNASGSAGSRYGVYGYAYGTGDNWGGYFPTKTYTSELRVGGTQGATGYVAAINGKLIAEEVRVELKANWPDYVFSKEHKLMSIEELETSVNTNSHLPGVPSACEVEENGIMLGAMQTTTMEKLEENTLYIIQLNNKIKELEKKIEALTNNK
jgi:hypothetical protein